MSHRIKPTVLVALAVTLLLVVLATGLWALVIPIVGAGTGFYYWWAKSVR